MELARLQEQLSTGQRINRPSDDPTSYGQARHMDLLTSRYAQYQRTVTSSRLWTDHTQGALNDIADLYMQITEQAVRAANDTFSSDDRETLAVTIESLLDTIVERLNTKVGDEYIFAGSRTTVEPFDDSGASVTYQGNSDGRQRTIGRDISLNINIDGDTLHDTGQGYTITDSVQNLVDAIRSGVHTDIETALDQLSVSRDHVIDLGGEAGNIADRLSVAETQIADATLLAEGRRSQLEDTNFAEAMMKFQKTQTGLQAALQVAASVLQISILDYLR